MPAFSPPLMPLTTRSGRRGQNSATPEFHAVGRAAFDGPAAPAVAVEHFLDRQRREERDRMADAALLGGRRDDETSPSIAANSRSRASRPGA